MSSSCLSSLIVCSWRLTMRTGSITSTADAAFCTRIMRLASRSVEMVSSRCADSPHMHANSSVLQLPPSASFSTFVSLVCRYGTCAPEPFFASATTHCSR